MGTSDVKPVTEQLTDEERAYLTKHGPTAGMKAVRIIDAHAADRAALVAQLEAANARREIEQSVLNAMSRVPEMTANLWAGEVRVKTSWLSDLGWAELSRRELAEPDSITAPTHAALAAQVAELTRERDEARDDVRAAHQAHASAVNAKQAEVSRLTQELAAAEREANAAFCIEVQLRQAAEARVRELDECLRMSVNQRDIAESECAALRADAERLRETRTHLQGRVNKAEPEVARLTKALKTTNDALGALIATSESKVTALTEECAALRAEVERLTRLNASANAQADLFAERNRAAETRLAAANALLERAYPHCPDAVTRGIAAHLAAQPATAPARTEAEGCGRICYCGVACRG